MPLVGMWSVEGTNLSSAPDSADTPVTGIQKVSVMEGGKFLESHWEYDFESGKHSGLSVIGIHNDDPQPQIFSFDNLGFYRIYRIDIVGKSWLLLGETERARMEFNEADNAYNESWEIYTDGQWRPLCRRVGKKHFK